MCAVKGKQEIFVGSPDVEILNIEYIICPTGCIWLKALRIHLIEYILRFATFPISSSNLCDFNTSSSKISETKHGGFPVPYQTVFGDGAYISLTYSLHMSGQFITTSAEVTPNRSLVRESPRKWP